jgi:uncharacterized protein YbjT (DUF2867 family)
MKILVFGANGGVGRCLIEQLSAAGHSVTAVLRHGRTLEQAHRGVQALEVAEMADPSALVPAMQGADAVMSGVGPRSTKDGPVAAPVTAAIVTAMRQAGVRRLVAVSAAPIGPVPSDESLLDRLILQPVARRLLRPVFDDLGKMEAIMAASELDCTAVRPPRLTNGALTGTYRIRVGGSLPRAHLISRADTAHAMGAVLADRSTFGQPVGVAY